MNHKSPACFGGFLQNGHGVYEKRLKFICGTTTFGGMCILLATWGFDDIFGILLNRKMSFFMYVVSHEGFLCSFGWSGMIV